MTAFSTLGLWAIASLAPAAERRSGFVPVKEGRLAYDEAGSGEAIVFLHDGLMDSATWDEQVEPFARHFRVVRYDRRGYGRSESQAQSYSSIDDLRGVLDQLAIRQATLVGCSSGGQLAVDFTLADPERVTGLVLVGPVVGGFQSSAHFAERGLTNFSPMFRTRDLPAVIENWVRDPYFTDPGNTAARAKLREVLTRSPGALTGAAGGETEPPPALPRLGQIRVPTLIVVGASDIPDVHAHIGALTAGIKGARRVVVQGAGHVVHLERPDVFNRTLLAFLRPGDDAAAWLASLAGNRVFEESRMLYDYDASLPLAVEEKGIEDRPGARVHDLSYASPRGGRVPAYLVASGGVTRAAGIVFVHPGQGNRATFLDEAVALAALGVESVLIDAPDNRPRPEGAPATRPWDPETDRAECTQLIVDVRRAFDLLAARPEVDRDRLAYVGHSLGATAGGTLAGVERRPKGFVLMAGYPSLTRAQEQGTHRANIAFRTLLTPEDQRRWIEALRPLDGVYYVGRAAPARLLFQFARHDAFIRPFDAEAYVRAASDPKQVEWYDTDHFFNEEARAGRKAWLTALLGLKAPNR